MGKVLNFGLDTLLTLRHSFTKENSREQRPSSRNNPIAYISQLPEVMQQKMKAIQWSLYCYL